MKAEAPAGSTPIVDGNPAESQAVEAARVEPRGSSSEADVTVSQEDRIASALTRLVERWRADSDERALRRGLIGVLQLLEVDG